MSMNRFADYFVICGLDLNSGLEPDKYSEDNLHIISPLERSYKGKVLAHYPENVSHNPFDASAVCMLCLPQGLKFRTQKHSVTQAPVFHSFLITREDGKRCYGFSLIFYEEVKNRDICIAMQTLQAMYITELSSGLKVKAIQNAQNQGPQSRSLPRHFKLATNNPSSSVSPAYYDISRDKLFVSKCIGIICQTAYIQAAKIFLENLYRCVPRRSTTSAGGLSLESYVFNLIYEVQLPEPGKSIMVYLPPSDPQLTPSTAVLQSPAPPLELPHFDYALRLMFTWLGVDVVVQIFTCLLLENQVLLRSTDCQRLMTVAEGLTSLIFPFTWPHVYVPILPASLHHFLDAPVPFLMGLYASSDNIKVASEATLCYVDLDKCKVQRPEETPGFPHADAFAAEIWAALDKYGVHVPNSDMARNKQDVMSRSCTTLPSGGRPSPLQPHHPQHNNPHHQNRRKLSIHDALLGDHYYGDRPPSPPGSARSEALQRIADIVRRTGVAFDQNYYLEGGNTTSNYLGGGGSLSGSGGAKTGGLNSYQQLQQQHQQQAQTPVDTYVEDMRFNNSIREIFLNRFVHVFQSYENFVIFPNQGKEDWFNNRDSMQNFDKASFLSDQPEQHRLFLCRFLESQMFATLIDSKILSMWGEQNPNLNIFDNRIRLLKQRYGGENVIRSLSYEPCTIAHDTQKLLEQRLTNPDFESPLPKEIMNSVRTNSGSSRQFPLLDKDILNKTPVVNKGSIPRASSLRKGLALSSHLHQLQSSTTDKANNPNSNQGQEMSPALIAQANWTFVEKLLKDCKAKTKRMLLAKLGAEGVTLSNSNVPENNFGAVEESTLVASLCELLERIWSHGLQRRKGKSALWTHLLSYQETHGHQQQLVMNKLNDGGSTQYGLSPGDISFTLDNHHRLGGGKDYASRSLNRGASIDSMSPLPDSLLFDITNVQAMSDVKTGIGMAKAWVRLALEKKKLSRHFRTLLSDQNLLRSQYKRSAFLRCEEEKEQFLYHLLSLNAVDYFCFTSTYPTTVTKLARFNCGFQETCSFIRRLIFIGADCTDHVIPFSCHREFRFILQLDIDNKFPLHLLFKIHSKKVISYRILIVPNKKGATTSANAWIVLSGTLSETRRIPVPKSTLSFDYKHKNLGVLTTLRIGHDNSGMYAKWMIDHIVVRNDVTGHVYKFPCGRWLGKGVDDGSTERLLVGNLLPTCQTAEGGGDESSCNHHYQTGSGNNTLPSALNTPPRCRSPAVVGTGSLSTPHIHQQQTFSSRTSFGGSGSSSSTSASSSSDQLKPSQIQHMLGDCVNSIIKWHYRRHSERHTTLTALLCGEQGLVRCLEHVFLLGFKSARLFVGKHYLWDYFVRVKEHFEVDLLDETSGNRVNSLERNHQEIVAVWRCYCHLIDEIMYTSNALGKDGKFQLFICLSVREHLLHRMLVPMAASKVTLEMYEESSFLRNKGLLTFLRQILLPLDELDVVLENSVTHGISSPSTHHT